MVLERSKYDQLKVEFPALQIALKSHSCVRWFCLNTRYTNRIHLGQWVRLCHYVAEQAIIFANTSESYFQMWLHQRDTVWHDVSGPSWWRNSGKTSSWIMFGSWKETRKTMETHVISKTRRHIQFLIINGCMCVVGLEGCQVNLPMNI